MSFLQSPPPSPNLQASEPGSYYDWILGCSYLFVAVIVLSLYTVLQVIHFMILFVAVRTQTARIHLQCEWLCQCVLSQYHYQAATLISFPAPLTLCTIASIMGAIFTAILQVIVEGKIDIGSPRIDLMLISGIVILVWNRTSLQLAAPLQNKYNDMFQQNRIEPISC